MSLLGDDDVWDDAAWGMGDPRRDPTKMLPPGYLEAKKAWLLKRAEKQQATVRLAFGPDDAFHRFSS